MRRVSDSWRHALRFGALLAVAITMAAPVHAASDSLRVATTLSDPPQPGQVIEPKALAHLLADSTAKRPVLLHVGFKVLFKGGHIPGSRYVGPASKPEGLAALKQELAKIPRQQAVVLYCGCCPWTDCPNVRPAYQTARELGFKDVRVLNIAKNLQHDWADAGLPMASGER